MAAKLRAHSARSPFPAGRANDKIARVLAERMRSSLGQPIITENVGGANGSIIGRNTFQRPKELALEMLNKIIDIYLGKA